jgi:hypothetical protein
MPPDRPDSPPPPSVETDPRFPSCPWQGFFLMAHWPGRHTMELDLTFHQGVMTGEGRDMIGPFLIRGKYNINDGKCHWSKRYVGKHDVAYQGYNEGKGIWGVWEIPPTFRGGFHIWPTAMGDPTSPKLTEALDEPMEFQSVQEEGLQVEELQPAGIQGWTPHRPNRAHLRRRPASGASPRSQHRRSLAKASQLA